MASSPPPHRSPDADQIVPYFGELFLDEPLPKDGFIDLPDSKATLLSTVLPPPTATTINFAGPCLPPLLLGYSSSEFRWVLLYQLILYLALIGFSFKSRPAFEAKMPPRPQDPASG